MDKFQIGTLRAYEVLKGLGGASANRLTALLAFMEPEFAARDGQLLNTSEFIASVNGSMKLALTEDAFQDILPHIEKAGWLEKGSSSLGETQYRVNCHKPPIPTPTSLDILGKLAERFAGFLDARDVSHSRFPRDKDYLGECLVEWLLSIDTSDEFSMAAATTAFNNSSDQIEYFCARFVAELIDERSADVQDLQLLANVGLLSDLVREFGKPLNEVKSTDLSVILDSPILLELLGVSGESSRLAANALIKKLSARGAKFLYFDASINELQHSIKGMLDLPVYERYGPTHAAMQRHEIDEGYVRSVYHNCRQLLQELSVLPLSGSLKHRSTNWHLVSAEHVDRLTRDLVSVYDTQKASQFRARHDANAVAAIMRLRGGEFASNDLFKAKYIFLTRNETFRNTARAFCLRDTPRGTALMSDEEVGPVVDIKEMASAIFARMPSSDSDEFSRLALLSGCERVLRLNRKTVAKISTLVNRMGLRANDNTEAIRKVRIAMLHPGSALYIQDRLRGENRELSYEEVLAEQKRYERDNIDKGIEKNRDHYNEQIQTIELSLQEKVGEIAGLRETHKAEVNAMTDAIGERDAALEEIKARVDQASARERDRYRALKEKEERRAKRIIANVQGAHGRMKRRIRLTMFSLIAIVVVAKMFVEKVWYASLKATLLGVEIDYWVVLGILLALALVALESSGGMFGDTKIPFVRNRLAARLRAHMESDREYDEFRDNEFGMTIEQEGFEFQLVEKGPAENESSSDSEVAEASDSAIDNR